MVCYRGYFYSWVIHPLVPYANVFIRKGKQEWKFTIYGSYGKLIYELIGAMACHYIDELIKRQ